MLYFSKKLYYYVAVLMVGIIFVSCLAVFTSKDAEEKNCYNIRATVEGEHLKGDVTLKYINLSGAELNELYFCLYPNAFKTEENLNNVVVADRVDQAYPNGFSQGYINVEDVSVNGESALFKLEENEQILAVEIGRLKNGKTAEINIRFNEKLPESPMRYGYGEHTFNYGNWYPIVCPIENGEAVKSVYTANGDPFYSECADYNLELSLAPEYRIATSGIILDKVTVDPTLTKWNIKGENIRDLAFVISEYFNVKSKKVGNTVVYSYYVSDDSSGEAALSFASDAVLCFNKLFGEYPYSTLSVVASDFYIGGMEYPNLIMVDKTVYGRITKEVLEEIVVHEVAHQWWYGIVGNNEIDHPWIDEGLTQYSVGLYYEREYGKERYDMFLRESDIYTRFVFDLVKDVNGTLNTAIDRHSTDFEHWLLYDCLTYDVSAIMYDSVRKNIGDEKFFNMLRYYLEENKYKEVDREKLFEDFNKSTGKNIEALMIPWLDGTVYWG